MGWSNPREFDTHYLAKHQASRAKSGAVQFGIPKHRARFGAKTEIAEIEVQPRAARRAHRITMTRLISVV
jgi:hypothetical protein